MSIIALLVLIWIGFVLSGIADAFPQLLWGWIHLPSWLATGLWWSPLLAAIAWCMKEEP